VPEGALSTGPRGGGKECECESGRPMMESRARTNRRPHGRPDVPYLLASRSGGTACVLPIISTTHQDSGAIVRVLNVVGGGRGDGRDSATLRRKAGPDMRLVDPLAPAHATPSSAGPRGAHPREWYARRR
jgi:hypothetical protein